MRAFLFGLSLACLALAGCDANYHSVYRTHAVGRDEAEIVTVDAKQRSILTAEVPLAVKDGGDPQAIRRFCAEPSPDVFSVIAQSFSGGGEFGKGADPTTIQLALRVAFSSAEQGATIPRTQTINMLRELMYRTCERYLSGGYDELELSVQALRDQRLIVSILAIEQLTGVVTPAPVVIAANGGAGTGATGEAIVRLDDAAKAKDAAAGRLKTSTASYDALNVADSSGAKLCETLAATPADKIASDMKDKAKACGDAASAKKSATEASKTADERYAELSTLAGEAGVTAVTAVSRSVGSYANTEPVNVANVTSAVQAIVEKNISDNSESLIFCMRILGKVYGEDRSALATSSSLRNVCVDYIKQAVEADALEIKSRVEQARIDLLTAYNAKFEKLWTPQVAAFFAATANRTAVANFLAAELITSQKPKAACFRASGEKAKVAECFVALEPQGQDMLIEYLDNRR